MGNAEISRSEAAYFDGVIAQQGEFNPFGDRGWNTLARLFSERVNPTAPLELLDVGCGTGNSRQIYLQHCRSYTGMDLSPSAIAVAKRKFPESQWMVADATQAPFPENRFDVVAFSSVLHHIPDFLPALKEAYRVLRPGGHVFAFDPNLLHPAMALFRWPKSPLYTANGVSPNESPLMPGLLRKNFQDAGFVQIHQRAQADLPYRAVAPKLLNAMLAAYNAGDWLMARLRIDRHFGCFNITSARKPGGT